MTPKERAAMQQALDYLENSHARFYEEREKTITALREALEQPNCQCGDKCFPVFSGDIEYCETCGKPTALAKQATVSGGLCGGCAKKAADGWALYCVECWEQAEQEPVVKIHKYNEFQTLGSLNLPIGTKLYAAPVRTKDLTDGEVWCVYQGIWPFHPAEEPKLADDIARFARAVIAKYKEKNRG